MEITYFGFGVALATILWKLVEGAISYREKTFFLRQLEASGVTVNFHGQKRWQHLPMSFLNNWSACWGDFILFPVINALVVPELFGRVDFWRLAWLLLLIACGLLVSASFHRQWPEDAANHGHIFAIWRGPSYLQSVFWPAAMSKAGWCHFGFMAIETAILLGFVAVPMPRPALVVVPVLLIYFVTLQQAQAILVQNLDSRRASWLLIKALAIIFLVSLIKTA